MDSLYISPRMTQTYKPGSGDLGYSTILHNHAKLRKDHPACNIQGASEALRHSVEKLLAQERLLQDDLNYFLNWLDRNIFSLAAFCYMKGDSQDHVFPDEVLDFLKVRTISLKEDLGDCLDFQSQSHLRLILIDGIRVEARALERAYIAWWHSSEVMSFLMTRDDLITNIRKNSAILNSMSSYLYEACRMEALLMKERGDDIQPRYWQAKVEPFAVGEATECLV